MRAIIGRYRERQYFDLCMPIKIWPNGRVALQVETIGDAYMVVGGMPTFTRNHADRALSMAFGMIEVSERVLSPVDQQPIQVSRSDDRKGQPCSMQMEQVCPAVYHAVNRAVWGSFY